MKKNLLTLDVALSKEIKYMLKEEHYLPGDKLPSERKLAELFHVQRLTVRGALNLLLQDKTIISKPRSGYYVAPKHILQSREREAGRNCNRIEPKVTGGL